ncbi:MAG: T9SS type A sorting domain-containing protein [Bacteroidetes bacterium]|nr:T9SS type A sorting domain-containing protein [Bacteroidota bacterium]
MRLKIFFLSLIFVFSNLIAQDYPEVSIRDIQFAPVDSLLLYGGRNSEPKPNFLGDTVIVTGVVMNSPHQDADPTKPRSLHSGAPAFYLQDTAYAAWSGILVRDIKVYGTGEQSVFATLDSGLVVKLLGVVGEYYTTTQFNAINFTGADVLGIMKRPEPVTLTLDSLVQIGSALPKYEAEKWEGVYVEIKNVTTFERLAIGYNTFKIMDENSSNIVVGNVAAHWRTTSAPLDGTSIESVRGYIETRNNITNGWFMLNPVYPDDIEYGDISPPNIYNVLRDNAVVNYGQTVNITATIVDSDNTADVKDAKLYYSVNDGEYISVDLTKSATDDTTWSASIPAVNDSALVKYYLEAVDMDDAINRSPSNFETSPYFYLVLNRNLTIQDVQYSPFGSGYSAYNNYEITVQGVVTADTSDIQGDGASISPQVYIQNGPGPWSGVQIFGTQADVLQKRDLVTVTGIVNESFGITRIGTLEKGVKVTKDQSGVDLPGATVISTADISASTSGKLPAESYEGVLVMYKNITVLRENADGNPGADQGTGGNRNFGEMVVADASNVQTRVELQDGTHDYHNFWDTSLENTGTRITNEDKFESIMGIMFYSFSNYKLVPRNNGDFIGHLVVGVNDNIEIPSSFTVSQNYPNPFNPTTTIVFSIPTSENVQIRVFNLLGQVVKEITNQRFSAGTHNVNFSAGNLSSGLYIYQVSAGKHNSVNKMMLLK